MSDYENLFRYGKLVRDSEGNEVWSLTDSTGSTIQVSSDSDALFIANQWAQA